MNFSTISLAEDEGVSWHLIRLPLLNSKDGNRDGSELTLLIKEEDRENREAERREISAQHLRYDFTVGKIRS